MNNGIVWFTLRVTFKATFTGRKITFINLPETRASLLVTRALFISLVDAIFPLYCIRDKFEYYGDEKHVLLFHRLANRHKGSARIA